MLLIIYLGTIVVTLTLNIKQSKALKKYVEGDGYKLVEKKEPISKQILGCLRNILKCSIPILNIVQIVGLLYAMYRGDEFLEEMETDLLWKKQIYRPTKNELHKESESQGSNQEKSKVYTENIQICNNEKDFSQMTIEEKMASIREEREKLINASSSQTERPATYSKKRK